MDIVFTLSQNEMSCKNYKASHFFYLNEVLDDANVLITLEAGNFVRTKELGFVILEGKAMKLKKLTSSCLGSMCNNKLS